MEKCFCHFNGYQVKDSVARMKTEGIVTPEMYGAKGDGVTDDSAAFQSAINSGCAVKLLNKTYLIAETLVISDYVEIAGNKERTVINFTGNGFLFHIKTTTLTKPKIHDIEFTGVNNGFIFADREGWGVSFDLVNFVVSGFNDKVFHINSGTLINIENGRILSDGKILFDTFDGTYAENFSNQIYFKSVYYTGLNKPEEIIVLNNVYTMTFDNCAFEKAVTLFVMRNKTRNISYNHGWIELVDNIYDTTGEKPNIHKTAIELVNRYDAKNELFKIPSNESKAVMFKTAHSDTFKALFDNNEFDLYHYMLYNEGSGYSSTQYLIDITSKRARFLQPLNTIASAKNGQIVTERLDAIVNFSNVNCVFETIIKVAYADYSTNWHKCKVCKTGEYFVPIETTLTYSQSWEGAIAAQTSETVSIEDGALKVACAAEATVTFITQFSTFIC